MPHRTNILLAFYGDDFTGSTDALEFMTRAGATTALFIEPPTAEQLQKYPGLNAFGVAGKTRAMPPADMEQTLLPAFEQLKRTGARHVHYKVCSTFDSSPTIGSIGKAIDTGASVFKNEIIPLLVAAPVLGRYCLFGNLFARMGIGSKGDIYRLDRHPSMSRHPVTPADESDLRLHLGKQTAKKTGLVDILHVSGSKEMLFEQAKRVSQQGAEVILFDALYQEQLARIGEWMDEQANGNTLFSAGSSGIEMALGQYWNQKNILQPVQQWPTVERAAPMLVIAGSCSPVTAGQINHAKSAGFEEVIIDVMHMHDGDEQRLLPVIVQHINNGKSVVLHTGGSLQKQEVPLPAEKTGLVLGTIAMNVAAQTKLRRMVIAGGDTSSYAARAMGIEAVQMMAPIVPGAPLCKATAPGSPVHGLEVNFKGGQVGDERYFEIVQNGTQDL